MKGDTAGPESRGMRTDSSVTQQIVCMLRDICALTGSCKQAGPLRVTVAAVLA